MKIHKSKENLLNIVLIIKYFKIWDITKVKHSIIILVKYKTINKPKIIFKTIIVRI